MNCAHVQHRSLTGSPTCTASRCRWIMTRVAPRVCPSSWPALIAVARSCLSAPARTSDSAECGRTATMITMCTSFAQAGPTQVRRHPVAQRARFSTDQTAGGIRHCGLWWHRRACATGVELRYLTGGVPRQFVQLLLERAKFLLHALQRGYLREVAAIVSLLWRHFFPQT